MALIELSLQDRRNCLDVEYVFSEKLEDQAELLRPHLDIWLKYQDVKLVFRAHNQEEYSAEVPKAANGGEAHTRERSIAKFLEQPLHAQGGSHKDVVVGRILGITATGEQLRAARFRVAQKFRARLKKIHQAQTNPPTAARQNKAPSRRDDRPTEEAADTQADASQDDQEAINAEVRCLKNACLYARLLAATSTNWLACWLV